MAEEKKKLGEMEASFSEKVKEEEEILKKKLEEEKEYLQKEAEVIKTEVMVSAAAAGTFIAMEASDLGFTRDCLVEKAIIEKEHQLEKMIHNEDEKLKEEASQLKTK